MPPWQAGRLDRQEPVPPGCPLLSEAETFCHNTDVTQGIVSSEYFNEHHVLLIQKPSFPSFYVVVDVLSPAWLWNLYLSADDTWNLPERHPGGAPGY